MAKSGDYWESIPMTERKMIDEGAPVTTPEDGIQRKEAIMRRNFCVYVQKMHQDKNTPFVTEYQVLWTSAAPIAVVVCVGGSGVVIEGHMYSYTYTRHPLY